MSSSSRVLGFAALLAVAGSAAAAPAQQPAQGFAVDRLYPSAPGAGWFVMDDLDMHGGLGGVLGLTLGNAGSPLRVGGMNVVSDYGSADLAAALTYRRWRFYLDIGLPFAIAGQGGVAGAYTFTAPSLSLGSNPDAISDPRIGTDVRIVGKPGDHFRFGLGAQLIIPNGNRSDYVSDGTFRGMVRALVAGDARWFTYAAQLGVHIRPLDDAPAPGSPQGSELLFGVAAGAKLPVGRNGNWIAVVGPEIYGASAFKSFFDANATAVEGLLTGRLEGTRDNKAQVRIKLGVGAGLNPQFGAAEWRIIAGVELFGQHVPASPSRSAP